ncbi:hypothetical protein AXW67_00565 [Bradyrhizobium neotropicale]|uniref:Uncharacterized protein n=1 Tax=Bradyrhizobium neotropicale TaxID=1497615 RepID=A0A176Z133_9BRAD|nr:hypothetical protein AXW67_00565 [Bradyrhizobium neotropicale]
MDHRVILPDGYITTREEAIAKGFSIIPWPDTEKSAIPHPHEEDNVVLPRGTVVSRETAHDAGFSVRERGSIRETDGPRRWRAAIMTLAEATERPSATAELLTSRTPENLTVEQARAFLRGLPIETEQATEETMTTNDDPRSARRAEIAASMQAFNRDRGWAQPQSAAPKQAPAVSNVEPEKLRRLAEIRFNALQMNGQGHTAEAKKLKYALDTHATTGAPLSRFLAQLEVDTSKLIPANI